MGKIYDTYSNIVRGLNTQRAAQVDQAQAATKNTELQNRITQMKLDHSEAVKSQGAAESAFKTGDLKGMVQYLGKVYDNFPDGGKIGKVHHRADGMVVDIHNRDGTMRQELVTHQNAQNYLEKGRAILDPQAYISARLNLDAERDGFNKVQKQKPQETVDGTYAYQQMDDKGNFKWVEVDAQGKEKELKSKPKLLSEQTEKRRVAQDWRKGEADIAAKEASTQKDLAEAEYARAGKSGGKESAESYPGEHSDKISKGIYENFGVTAGPDKEGNVSTYGMDTKTAVDKDLASRGRTGLWKPKKVDKRWGPGGEEIEYEYMGHTEAPKEGDILVYADKKGKTHEYVIKGGKPEKRGEEEPERKAEDIPAQKTAKIKGGMPSADYDKEVKQVARWILEDSRQEDGQMERLVRQHGKVAAEMIMRDANRIIKPLKEAQAHPFSDPIKKGVKILNSAYDKIQNVPSTHQPWSIPANK